MLMDPVLMPLVYVQALVILKEMSKKCNFTEVSRVILYCIIITYHWNKVVYSNVGNRCPSIC